MRISDWSSDVCSSDLMERNGFITREQELAARAMPLGLVRQKEPASSVESGYFLEEVRRQLIEQFGETDEDGPNSVYGGGLWVRTRSEEHTSELQSLMRIPHDVCCLKKKKNKYKPRPWPQYLRTVKRQRTKVHL